MKLPEFISEFGLKAFLCKPHMQNSIDHKVLPPAAVPTGSKTRRMSPFSTVRALCPSGVAEVWMSFVKQMQLAAVDAVGKAQGGVWGHSAGSQLCPAWISLGVFVSDGHGHIPALTPRKTDPRTAGNCFAR